MELLFVGLLLAFVLVLKFRESISIFLLSSVVMTVSGLNFLMSYSSSIFIVGDNLMMDSMSSLMIVLVFVVMIISVVCSEKEFSCWSDVSGFGVSMVSLSMVCCVFFMSSSILSFYFFFESSLIPTLFLILGWGYQPERLQAGLYMMLYTVSASMPLFVIICLAMISVGSDSLVEISYSGSTFVSSVVWFMLILGFLVKLPVFLVHGWLPKAHVEAPVSGSMVLAGILLKLGGFGLYRMFMVFSYAGSFLSDVVLVSSLWGGLLCSVMCMCQSDVKALIAYSSISHMSLVLGGVVSLFSLGWVSGVCLMFAHGLCSPCMFSLANYTYSVFHTRSLAMCKGLLKIFPGLSFIWFLISVLNMACPPSINFLSEVFLVGSVVFMSWFYLLPLGLMCFFTAGYCLFLYCSINHGGVSKLLKPMSSLGDRVVFSVMTCGVCLFTLCLCLDLVFV